MIPLANANRVVGLNAGQPEGNHVLKANVTKFFCIKDRASIAQDCFGVSWEVSTLA
jgi:hypothetical protein